MLNRNGRLLLWWSQQKKDVNDVNLQFDNSQSGHGRIAPPPLDPPLGGRHRWLLLFRQPITNMY